METLFPLIRLCRESYWTDWSCSTFRSCHKLSIKYHAEESDSSWGGDAFIGERRNSLFNPLLHECHGTN